MKERRGGKEWGDEGGWEERRREGRTQEERHNLLFEVNTTKMILAALDYFTPLWAEGKQGCRISNRPSKWINSGNSSRRGNTVNPGTLKIYNPQKMLWVGRPDNKEWGRSEVCEDSSYSDRRKVSAWRKERQIALITSTRWTEREAEWWPRDSWKHRNHPERAGHGRTGHTARNMSRGVGATCVWCWENPRVEERAAAETGRRVRGV